MIGDSFVPSAKDQKFAPFDPVDSEIYVPLLKQFLSWLCVVQSRTELLPEFSTYIIFDYYNKSSLFNNIKSKTLQIPSLFISQSDVRSEFFLTRKSDKTFISEISNTPSLLMSVVFPAETGRKLTVDDKADRKNECGIFI